MTAWGKMGLLLGGFAIGTYGTKILGSKPMKKAYTQITAGALWLKDEVMKDATIIGENAGDIAADAKIISEKLQKQREEQKLQDARDLLANAEAASKATSKSAKKSKK